MVYILYSFFSRSIILVGSNPVNIAAWYVNCQIHYRFANLLKLTTTKILTLDMQGPSHFSLTRSISWLLMPWLLRSPGHQHQWYWLCRIDKFLSYLKEDFNYLHVNVDEWHKIKNICFVPSEQFSMQRVKLTLKKLLSLNITGPYWAVTALLSPVVNPSDQWIPTNAERALMKSYPHVMWEAIW